jgi:arginyl-tRNA--protein-N-Asp/Glu arginylyltransferase
MTSVADVVGWTESSRCGYCNNPTGSFSFGVWMHALTVDDYSAMLDRGWRRSGHYLYRPDLRRSCCQAFVIRLRVDRFRPSTGQTRVLKRLRRVTARANPTSSTSRGAAASKFPSPAVVSASDSSCEATRAIICDALVDISSQSPTSVLALDPEVVRASVAAMSVRRRSAPSLKQQKTGVASVCSSTSINPTSGSAAEITSNAAMVVAATERKATRVAVFATTGAAVKDASMGRKEYIEPVSNVEVDTKGTRDICVVAGSVARQMAIARAVVRWVEERGLASHGILSIACASPGWINVTWLSERDFGSATAAVAKPLSREPSVTSPVNSPLSPCAESPVSTAIGRETIQRAVGVGENDDSSNSDIVGKLSGCEMDVCAGDADPSMSEGLAKTDLRTTADGRVFDMRFVHSQFEQDEYELYCRYQMDVHQSTPRECRVSSYRRFLVDTPLIARGKGEAGCPPLGYGSFHIRYTLDDVLFAVGVVDVLPNCLSSVYLFFDPAFADLSPGVLSAIKEIEWVQHVSAAYGATNFTHYYLGFFIPTCEKMARKAAYRPSEILCEETRLWVDATDAQSRLSSAEERGERTTRLAADSAEPSAAVDALTDDVVSSVVEQSATLVGGGGSAAMPFSLVARALGGQPEVDEVLCEVRKRIAWFVTLVGPVLARQYEYVLR